MSTQTTQGDPAPDNKGATTPPATGGADGGGAGDERLQHALRDMHRFKEEAKKAKAELDAVKEAKLKEQNDWKALYDKRDQEAKEAAERETKLKNSFMGHQKYSAVKDAAIKAGIRDVSDLSLMPLDDVQVETTSTGNINILGADLFVEKLKASRPHWFGSKTPDVNTGTPGVTGGAKPLTMADVMKAENVAKSTGDYTKYEAVLKQWKSQKK
jgi:hypothetical protein